MNIRRVQICDNLTIGQSVSLEHMIS